ncbi:MAG: hypothetical protein KC983_03955 [Phycisphaerales bacterium]|nr:hypothetical protein [Phycisphaerales bacterium]
MTKRWMHGVRHAFAVDPPGPATPTPEQADLIDQICEVLARKHIATPAMVMLEVSRPLNYVGAQVMTAFGPVMWTILRKRGYAGYKALAAFLEHRGSVDYILQRIEHFEANAGQRGGTKSSRPSETPDPSDADDTTDSSENTDRRTDLGAS